MRRQTGLAVAHAGTPTNYDQALLGAQQNERRIPQLEAQIKQTEGALADAEYQLSQRRVIAYTEGRVEDIFFREGEWAPSSTPVVEILPPANIYVRFFIPETQLQEVKLGQKVAISCDSCKPLDGDHHLHRAAGGIHRTRHLQRRQPRESSSSNRKRASPAA